MDIYHTIIRPIVTEKSNRQAHRTTEKRGGGYSFEVHPEANKTQIRDAVEKIYGVKVRTVCTSNQLSKRRRFRLRFGQPRHTKKAIVYLDKNSHIDLF